MEGSCPSYLQLPVRDPVNLPLHIVSVSVLHLGVRFGAPPPRSFTYLHTLLQLPPRERVSCLFTTSFRGFGSTCRRRLSGPFQFVSRKQVRYPWIRRRPFSTCVYCHFPFRRVSSNPVYIPAPTWCFRCRLSPPCVLIVRRAHHLKATIFLQRYAHNAVPRMEIERPAQHVSSFSYTTPLALPSLFGSVLSSQGPCVMVRASSCFFGESRRPHVRTFRTYTPPAFTVEYAEHSRAPPH